MSEGIKVEVTETIGSKVEEPQKQAPVEVKKTEEPKYVRVEDLEKVNQAINNTREYNTRKLQEINDKLERLMPKPVVTGDEDLDELVQRDWKMGIQKMVEKTIEKKQQMTEAQTNEQRVAQILEESKSKVMSKHPELSDPENPKTKEFLKVLDENPDFRTNPRGPLLAAYEMENRLKAHDTLNSKETKVPNQGKEQRSRAASVPAGTSPAQKSSYSLSKADMDFCRLNNINPENYKKYRGMKEVS